MDYNQAKIQAQKGYTLILPYWKGYFKWNYSNNELYFQNGDYYLNSQQIIDKGLHLRNDWYYIL